jgi:hypothetical protein
MVNNDTETRNTVNKLSFKKIKFGHVGWTVESCDIIRSAVWQRALRSRWIAYTTYDVDR